MRIRLLGKITVSSLIGRGKFIKEKNTTLPDNPIGQDNADRTYFDRETPITNPTPSLPTRAGAPVPVCSGS